MFNKLRNKLKGFLSKASEELEEGEEERGGKKPAVPGRKRKRKDKGKERGKTTKRKMRVKRRGPSGSRGEGGLSTVDKSKMIRGAEGGFAGKKISEKRIDDILWELEIALYESDVATAVVDEITEKLRERLLGVKIRRGLSLQKVITRALKNAVEAVLAVEPFDFDAVIESTEKPVVLMFVGINGTGKTTTIGKIARRLLDNGQTCVMAACDTFRAGAIEQLGKHAQNLGVKLIKQPANTDPAAVAYDAIEHANARKKDVVLIDTAGRMHSNVNLMNEMRKLKNVARPDVIIFVGDALAGNDVIEQAEKFDEWVGIDATVLSKIDADAKGGAALSIAHTVGKPIVFVGVGQEYEDLQEFNPYWMLQRLFN